jgi:sulfite exporter TauE/SafE
MEHDMAGMDHSQHMDNMAGMEHMDHAMQGMADIATASGFDYSLAVMAGFLGSGHCLGMCGALVSGYFMNSGKTKSVLPYLAYQFTRISVYGLVGVSAAALGVVLVASGLFGKMQSILQILIGCVVIILAMGILGWIPWQGSIRLLPRQSLRSGYAAARQKGPILGAMIAGFLNGLMPCPLTFAMAVKATSAHSLLEGGLLMLAFGAGTLPMMLFISVAFGKIHAKVRGLMLKAAALVMIVMGGNTIHKGLSFYLHENFKHSTFLAQIQSKLDEFTLFLGRLIAYIGDMIGSIHSL